MAEFRLNKVSAGNKVGRPEDSGMMEAFENICEWLENCADCELQTVSDLHEKMTQANDGPVYTLKSFRQKLKSRYKDHVYFVEDAGHCDIVCFKDMTKLGK